MTKFDVSERLACRVLGQHRSTQRKSPKGRADDAALTADIVALATEYGRYGYRRITAMLRAAGWAVNVKRVERIWRLEGLGGCALLRGRICLAGTSERRATMECPIDGTQLVMTERSGVEIDYCPKCRGVWLDRGELDKIIERGAAQAVAPQPASRGGYDPRPEDSGGKPYKKKREGFLGELFDF